MAHENIKWTETLPAVLLGLRVAVKPDINASSAELVYGVSLRLPAEICTDTSSMPLDYGFVQQLKNHMNHLKPLSTSTHGFSKIFVHPKLDDCSHVFLRVDKVSPSLSQPYTGPHEVLSRNDKRITININGKKSCVSLDRVKPAFVFKDLPDTIPDPIISAESSHRHPVTTNMQTTKSGRREQIPNVVGGVFVLLSESGKKIRLAKILSNVLKKTDVKAIGLYKEILVLSLHGQWSLLWELSKTKVLLYPMRLEEQRVKSRRELEPTLLLCVGTSVLRRMKLFKKGKSYREIAKIVGRSHSCVQKIIGRFKSDGLIENKSGRGNKSILSDVAKRKVLNDIKIDPEPRAVKLAAEISRIMGRSVSAETVRNVIRHAGYSSRVARKKPFIILQNQKKHLEFAKTHQLKTDNFWKKVIFSDESKFNIFGSDGRRTVWRKPNTALDPKNLRPTVKHSGGSIMVWGCTASNGVENLVFIDGIYNRS
ncbi:transposable element Tc1 transposase [Trichonephila clavipes]|nr:transposable element Tc1 transposase [Trichonephila clavipes]